jgi:hypothetical protein
MRETKATIAISRATQTPTTLSLLGKLLIYKPRRNNHQLSQGRIIFIPAPNLEIVPPIQPLRSFSIFLLPMTTSSTSLLVLFLLYSSSSSVWGFQPLSTSRTTQRQVRHQSTFALHSSIMADDLPLAAMATDINEQPSRRSSNSNSGRTSTTHQPSFLSSSVQWRELPGRKQSLMASNMALLVSMEVTLGRASIVAALVIAMTAAMNEMPL